MTASCAYVGDVRHRRFEPIEHEFSYPMFLPYLDLEELPGVLARTKLWSATRPALARFRRSDFLGDPDVPLDDAVREVARREAGATGEGPVRMLASLRYFGHAFNPVAFYFCFRPGGTALENVVAEVTNTPWGERHAYAVAANGGRVATARLRKAFHVSPLMGMEHEYDLRVTLPGDRLAVHIVSSQEGRRVFDATMSLRRLELGTGTLDRLLMRYPAMTLRVLGSIYFEAARLRLKGARYHSHPERA
ncbi:MAG TPA: DUF1365 domain-containing protein [Solirubrobacterales bacterium]|nr:DUF1365 domain-containing protein [Solirubrobacterales bacterium]